MANLLMKLCVTLQVYQAIKHSNHEYSSWTKEKTKTMVHGTDIHCFDNSFSVLTSTDTSR